VFVFSEIFSPDDVQPQAAKPASRASQASAAAVDPEQLRKTAKQVYRVFVEFGEDGLTTGDATWLYVEHFQPFTTKDNTTERYQEFANARSRVSSSIKALRETGLLAAYGDANGQPVIRRPQFARNAGKQNVWVLADNACAVPEHEPHRCEYCGHALASTTVSNDVN
jgi:hypothetical protein